MKSLLDRTRFAVSDSLIEAAKEVQNYQREYQDLELTGNIDNDIKVLSENTKLAESADLAKMLKQYRRNEDNNHHTENYLMLAKAFGTKEQVAKVQEIMKRSDKRGYTPNEDSQWMYKNINPYYKRLRGVKEETEVDEARSSYGVTRAKGEEEKMHGRVSRLSNERGVTGKKKPVDDKYSAMAKKYGIK